MFELFGALFGGTYLASKVCRDKEVAREVERLIDADKKLNEYFASIATDENLELSIRKILDDPSQYERVWEDIRDVFAVVPLCDDLTSIVYFPEETHSYEYSMVLRILMAKNGKIPKLEARLTGEQTMFLPPQVLERSKQMRKKFKQLMPWIEKELQNHGVPVRLVIVVAPDADAYQQKLVPRGKEIYCDEYKDQTIYGEQPTDNIWGYRWKLK